MTVPLASALPRWVTLPWTVALPPPQPVRPRMTASAAPAAPVSVRVMLASPRQGNRARPSEAARVDHLAPCPGGQGVHDGPGGVGEEANRAVRESEVGAAGVVAPEVGEIAVVLVVARLEERDARAGRGRRGAVVEVPGGVVGVVHVLDGVELPVVLHLPVDRVRGVPPAIGGLGVRRAL